MQRELGEAGIQEHACEALALRDRMEGPKWPAASDDHQRRVALEKGEALERHDVQSPNVFGCVTHGTWEALSGGWAFPIPLRAGSP